MKLMRHGPKGAEKPALVDADGRVRDLSAALPDISAATLAPERLARLRDLDTSTLPLIEAPGRIAPPWSGLGKFVCSASTTPTTRPSPACRCRPSRCCS